MKAEEKKTAEECKNKIARKNNFDSFAKAIRYTFNRELLQSEEEFINKIIDESMEEYSSQANPLLSDEVEKIAYKLRKELESANMIDGFPLLDHLSNTNTIESGQREIENIVDQIDIHNLLIDTYKPKEWVSVEDRLPEKNVDVLILTDYEKMATAHINDYSKPTYGWIDAMRAEHGYGSVTHWMPLPEFKEKI